MNFRSLSLLLLLSISSQPHAAPQAGETYGPIENGQGLWSIANKTRPDKSVGHHQMMLALLTANPDAFRVPCNLNTLKTGVTLSIPGMELIQRYSNSEALKEVQRQEKAWRTQRYNIVCPSVPSTETVAVQPAPKPEAVTTQPAPKLEPPATKAAPNASPAFAATLATAPAEEIATEELAVKTPAVAASSSENPVETIAVAPAEPVALASTPAPPNIENESEDSEGTAEAALSNPNEEQAATATEQEAMGTEAEAEAEITAEPETVAEEAEKPAVTETEVTSTENSTETVNDSSATVAQPETENSAEAMAAPEPTPASPTTANKQDIPDLSAYLLLSTLLALFSFFLGLWTGRRNPAQTIPVEVATTPQTEPATHTPSPVKLTRIEPSLPAEAALENALDGLFSKTSKPPAPKPIFGFAKDELNALEPDAPLEETQLNELLQNAHTQRLKEPS